MPNYSQMLTPRTMRTIIPAFFSVLLLSGRFTLFSIRFLDDVIKPIVEPSSEFSDRDYTVRGIEWSL